MKLLEQAEKALAAILPCLPAGKLASQVENIFYCASRRQVVGKTILLIDDVVTTGATLSAIAKACLKVLGPSMWMRR